MKTVAVVDYGMGNLRSVSQAVMHVAQGSGYDVIVTSKPEEVLAAERVVLPGQGAMPDCMHELRASGLQDAVLHAAANKPLMGVCVGMQMLLSRSEEGPTDGLGLIGGEVIRFQLEGRLQPDGSRYKVPQMGWNRVFQAAAAPACGRACPTARTSISCTATTPARRTRATAQAKPITAAALPARWRGIIFSPPSFTPRKAQNTAWPCTATSYAGIPERRLIDPRRHRLGRLPPPPPQLFGHAADSRD